MEIKKSSTADLENDKILFILIGLVSVLSFVYIGLEWTQTNVVKYDKIEMLSTEEQEELIPITVQEEKKEIAPPIPPPVVNEVINIVDNSVETDMTLQSTDVDQNTQIEIKQVQEQTLTIKVEDDPDEEQIFKIVEKMPSFPGGDVELMKFISNNIRYPVVAQENGIEGRVVVSFVVGKDGNITDAQILRGVDPNLDKEALRVVNSMPKWNVGEQRGKPVRVRFSIFLNFEL